MFLYSKLDMKKVTSPNEMPKEKHYAILMFENSSYSVEGDQRSIDCPGHGYPAHTVSYTTYEYWATKDKDTLIKAIELIESNNKKNYTKYSYSIIECNPLPVTTKIQITL
jgi:hypothetical protein